MLRRMAAAAGLLLALAMQPARADPVAVPVLAARVTDQTGTLTAEQSRMIETKLAWVERRTGAQIAVLIVPTTGSDSIEAYALRVFNSWGLGRKDIDDGVLLLVAKGDRRMRIEVGTGLETAIPDATALRIIQDDMVPAFRAGDFFRGLAAAIAALVPLIEQDGLPKPEKASQAAPMLPALAEAA
jgi:uncharacterized protein